jgi:hypothetical protein
MILLRMRTHQLLYQKLTHYIVHQCPSSFLKENLISKKTEDHHHHHHHQSIK